MDTLPGLYATLAEGRNIFPTRIDEPSKIRFKIYKDTP
jgi:hypothetical protein